jgi:hypothetical protein
MDLYIGRAPVVQVQYPEFGRVGLSEFWNWYLPDKPSLYTSVFCPAELCP